MIQRCDKCRAEFRFESSGEIREVVPFRSTADNAIKALRKRYPKAAAGHYSASRLLVPAFLVSAKAESKWSAELPIHMQNSTRWSSKSGTLKHTHSHVCVLAAEGAWPKGLRDLHELALAAVPVTAEHLSGAAVLEVDATDRQRDARVRQHIDELQSAEVRKAVGAGARKVSHSTEIEDLVVERVLIPLWGFRIDGPGSFEAVGYVTDTRLDILATAVRGEKSSDAFGRFVLASLVVAPVLFGLVCCGVSIVSPPSGNEKSHEEVPVVVATPAPPEVKVLVDVPALASKSVEAVDAALGKALSVTKITEPYVEQMPGEFRNYDQPDSEEPAQLRFFRGKAVDFVVYTPGSASPEEAAGKAGFKLVAAPDIRSRGAVTWKDVDAAGHRFQNVTVTLMDNTWFVVNVSLKDGASGR